MDCRLCVHNEKRDPEIDYAAMCEYCLLHGQIIYEFVHKDYALDKFRKKNND